MSIALLSGGSGGVVPEFTLEELAQIRGAMWTRRCNVPMGPRPNQDSNILAMDYYDQYNTADRKKMLDAYPYPTYVCGPMVDEGYHGMYQARPNVPTQAEWDRFLDSVEERYHAGKKPIYFAKPDGWENNLEGMDELDALHRQARAQKLLRIVCYPGWEPNGWKYGWNNDKWLEWCFRGWVVFPKALRCLHMTSDLDAPTGGNDSDVFPPGEGNAISWRNVAPYIHVWLDQVGGYIDGGNPVPSAEFLSEFAKHVKRCCDGFRHGVGGWPTFSAWGENKPIRYVAAEYASYGDFWWNWDEQYAKQIGDVAMANGADGFLDSGTL
jgi:hypothetical protein